MPNQKEIVLIDGHALAYRMYFAMPRSITMRDGELLNAVYGFTEKLFNLTLRDNPVEYLAVSFDLGATFRDDLFADYKGTREKMPDDLATQITRIQEVLEAFNVPVISVENYEADDVLGTIARIAAEQGISTRIITGDRDLLQLVDEHTLVQLPQRKSPEDQVFDTAAVEEKYGILPPRIVDLKALMGDSSDNIPGVKGVGEKTATKLLRAYGTLDGIYENLELVTPPRAKKALEADKESAYLSYKLAMIVTDVPLEFNLEACKTQNYDGKKVIPLFREFEFRRYLKELGELDEELAVEAYIPEHVYIVQTEDQLAAMVTELDAAEAIAFDTETTGTSQMESELVGISLTTQPGTGYYIPVGHIGPDGPLFGFAEDQLSIEIVTDALRPALTNPNIPKYGHNIKFDALVLSRYGLDVTPLSIDTMIGEWLTIKEPSRGRIGLKKVSLSRLGIQMVEIEKLIGKGKKKITMAEVPIQKAANYAAADSDITFQLAAPIIADIDADDLSRLFYEIEIPLVPVLVQIERNGVLLDSAVLKEMSIELRGMLDGLITNIHDRVGYPFNINSPIQLGKALFEGLGLSTEGVPKTKAGNYSTAAAVLESLRETDTTGMIAAILEYRGMEKLRSTYVDALPTMVNPQTGRIHSSFNQTGAVTGRISSSEPNLQNIPIRTEMGRRVRDAFIAPPGYKLLAADYSQVELRVLAHIADDEALKQAFIDDQDIHATTAAAVHSIPLEEVTHSQRSFAKSVNFGLLYGMGAFRLARDSDLSLKEAEAFIVAYFDRFPQIQGYLDSTKALAAEQGYVETLLKRRRYFPILQSEDKGRQAQISRRAAEREAINMPIQGTAADIMKIAMVDMHHALIEHNLSAKIILQVHDELVLEVADSEVEQIAILIREVMENVYPLSVPLKVDVNIGTRWGELK